MEKEIKDEIERELILFEKLPSIDNVYENIYIGNYASALLKDDLKLIGITHILVCGYNLREMFPQDFIYKTIKLYDSEYTKISKHFDISNEFINEGNSKGKILVHCGHGVSRSVSLVSGFLINFRQLPYSKSLGIIKEKRNIAKPNTGFDKELRNYSYQLMKKF